MIAGHPVGLIPQSASNVVPSGIGIVQHKQSVCSVPVCSLQNSPVMIQPHVEGGCFLRKAAPFRTISFLGAWLRRTQSMRTRERYPT